MIRRFRSIPACAVALLQLAAANAHEVHHVLQVADEEVCVCAHGPQIADSTPTDPLGAHSHGPRPHDCGECLECEASSDQIMHAPHSPRGLALLAVMIPMSDTLLTQLAAVSPSGRPPTPAFAHPADFHAVMLPLLD
jgi:hypothetical protein